MANIGNLRNGYNGEALGLVETKGLIAGWRTAGNQRRALPRDSRTTGSFPAEASSPGR